MRLVFHEGEREVQARAGVVTMAERLANGIHTTLPPAAQAFLRQQKMVILGSTDTRSAVWASLLTGPPGFAHAVNDTTVSLATTPHPGDPLHDVLTAASPEQPLPEVGLLAIELSTRRRMRVNGVMERSPDGGLILHARQVYANCQKYIQARNLAQADIPEAASSRHGEQLTPAQQAWIAQADTFFIASAYPGRGADASHRGGLPGFVQVVNPASLAFPDYAGNNMFNTLGNLTAHPNAGLLFADFESGRTLQLTGRARIRWDAESIARFPGAQRVVELAIDAVVETEHAFPLRGQLVEYSPFNPAPP